MKLGFVTRPLMDKTNPNEKDSTLYVKSVTYDSNWQNYENRRLSENEEFL